ncbi:putative Integrase family protein [Candidatus Desulfosporosinus infrequens]|uniref:Putative Integrase family protein n=1 Tax=Candidatus Desulfosporosinus infrequens TaxID=2043169 RepID=A0A2U3LUC7_9FIRM|nr:putative Integrase family protein [Candidatus Desulfosporosinus infrequens]
MPKMKLTDKAVDRLPLSADGYVVYYDTKLTGFGVRVGSRSKMYFVHKRIGNIQIKVSIGKTALLTFEDAYEKALQILKDAAQGITPDDRVAEQSRIAEERKAETTTFREMFDDYCATRKKLKQDTKDHYLDKLTCYLSDWLTQPLLSITPAMVVAKHAEIGKKSKAQADHVFRVLRAVFNHAMEMHDNIFTRNPVKRLSSVNAWYNVPRKQTFTRPAQLAAFFDAVEGSPGLVADYMTCLLFTGIRSASEIARVEVSHVDFKEKCISLFDTKTREFLIVPVGGHVLKILKRRHDDAVAQGTPFLFYAFQEQAARNGRYVPKKAGGHIKDVRGTIKTIFEGTELAQITPHDMRRTFLTYADEIGISNVVQKRLVGHAISQDVTDGYKVLTLERLRKEVAKVERFILKNRRAAAVIA